MTITLPSTNENIRVVMQRLGYNEHHDRNATEPSFAMRLSGARFPRFHGYIEERPDGWALKLHLDMQESKAYGSRHGGEYEGELVEREAARIQEAVAQYGRHATH
ncbi:MAG: hypothetical protein AAB633_01080 [Patescibacteria group bacterium]